MEIGEISLKEDSNFYVGFEIFESLGDIERIKQRINKGDKYPDGSSCYSNCDFVRATLNYGTDIQAENAIRGWLKEKNNLHDFHLEEEKYFKERLMIIQKSYEKFAKENKLPEKLPFQGGIASITEFINLACEIKKRGYGVVIGVLNGGIPIAQLLDYLGQNTRYVEWHRDWKKEPIWKKIGSNIKPLKDTEKIIICENDTRSGKTLEALIPFLKKLKPNKIDVSFLVDFYKKNQENTQKIGFYDELLSLKEISKDNLIQNLNKVVEYAKTKKIDSRDYE